MRAALAILAFGLLAGCASDPSPVAADPVYATPTQIARGQVMAQQKCGACHAVGLRDESAISTAPEFRTLGRRYPVSDLGEALAEGIVTGHPSMPDWVLTRDEIVELLGYMQSIQTR